MQKQVLQSRRSEWTALRTLSFRTVRKWSAHLRALPDFLVIGTQKAGTSAFQAYLGQHPQILEAIVKEVHYFDEQFERGDDWYRRHFPLSRTLRVTRALTGESTPHYLFHPRCAERIHARLPKVKLIAILRDPVERTISHYAMECGRGNERMTLRRALDLEERRIAAALRLMESRPREGSRALATCSYKSRGIYIEQLERFLKLFSRDQLLVLKAEDLRADPRGPLRRAFVHLGVEPRFIPGDLVPRNVGQTTVHVPSETRESLRMFFRPFNERLSNLLGEEFLW